MSQHHDQGQERLADRARLWLRFQAFALRLDWARGVVFVGLVGAVSLAASLGIADLVLVTPSPSQVIAALLTVVGLTAASGLGTRLALILRDQDRHYRQAVADLEEYAASYLDEVVGDASARSG